MKLSPISCKDVTIDDGFWKNRQDINKTVTVESVFSRFDDTGKIEAFWCQWKPGDDPAKHPHLFWDSDVAKWIEGASYILMHNHRPELQERIDHMVDGIEEHMTKDGYFNVYYVPFGLSGRFTDRNNHELYCAGHHFEAACAYYEATGKDKYLRLMERFAALIHRIFVVEGNRYFVTPGHPEIELALMTMYRTTKNPLMLELCRFFVEQRGANDKDAPLFGDKKYAFDEVPIREGKYADGHCVRLNYLMSGVCDLARETDDAQLFDACDRVFSNATEKRMYITGAQGSTHLGERYTSDYHLPNKTAYAETCASISLGMFARRMELFCPDSRYGDVVERVLYNGILSGVSMDGDSFFYENPLEIREEDYAVNYYEFENQHHYIPRTRRKMFDCSCCPPNILRLIASVGGYIYSFAEEENILFVNQFIASSFDDGTKSARLSTDFPSHGTLRLAVKGVAKVAVRIPYYAKTFTANAPYETRDGYAYFDVEGSLALEIDLNLAPRFVYANTKVYDTVGRAAVMYGPVVYCAESADNETVEAFMADAGTPAQISAPVFGVPGLTLSGKKLELSDALYSETPPREIPFTLKLIPYFAFANRGEGEMQTYFPIR